MDYSIDAFEILLNEDCIMERYYPLIALKNTLTENLTKLGCRTKSDCALLSDDALLGIGLPDKRSVDLFRRFLVMYDVKSAKLKEIDKAAANDAEAAAFRELYLLPGVKATRARLYYCSGYKGLRDIASALPEQIIRDTSVLIERQGLDAKAPLPKEVRTHIAVAKALTEYAVRE